MAENTSSLTLLVKQSTLIGVLFEAYAGHFDSDVTDYTFIFDGVRMNAYSTARDIGLEDGDMLEVTWAPTKGI